MKYTNHMVTHKTLVVILTSGSNIVQNTSTDSKIIFEMYKEIKIKSNYDKT